MTCNNFITTVSASLGLTTSQPLSSTESPCTSRRESPRCTSRRKRPLQRHPRQANQFFLTRRRSIIDGDSRSSHAAVAAAASCSCCSAPPWASTWRLLPGSPPTPLVHIRTGRPARHHHHPAHQHARRHRRALHPYLPGHPHRLTHRPCPETCHSAPLRRLRPLSLHNDRPLALRRRRRMRRARARRMLTVRSPPLPRDCVRQGHS